MNAFGTIVYALVVLAVGLGVLPLKAAELETGAAVGSVSASCVLRGGRMAGSEAPSGPVGTASLSIVTSH